ncbi:MAG: SIMPL domain-containing protein [Lachnospiraceae bacterium]|nr:SIMPL domain-containing protein [Lachnospiraceae bacterium]
MQTIRVTGKGRIRIKPDTTRVTMTLEGTYPEYSETLRRSSQDTEQLRELLTGFDYARADLKTLNFNVDTEYESCEEKGVYRQRFVGYKFHHLMKVEFPSDNDRLGRILYALANCPLNPQFRLSYTVKDQEAAKNELLAKAVIDAKEKAVVLTQAAGVSLGAILNIDYSWGELNFEVRPMNRMLMADACVKEAGMAKGASCDMDIEPDDIEAADTVTVVWEIG